jgi:alpha-L-fucosidase
MFSNLIMKKIPDHRYACKVCLLAGLFILILGGPLCSQIITIDRNKPEKKEWFSDLGFGMFIHWSVDVQLGAIISHNAAVASNDYLDQYFNELPKTFNPKKFDPEEWAKLAKLAGVKYMVFTAKHHNGFCMWDTNTSEFNIINSGYGKDILKEVIDAFRKYDIAIGLYFSPDDYYVMYKQGFPPSRNSKESESTRNTELWEINKHQLKELLGDYGKIDILFIDEKSEWANPLVANYAWDLNPDLLVTRGGMKTPEQNLPEQQFEGPWEACFTIGAHWQYVAGEQYKSASTLIDLLIETRAKGGNLLLNVGPDTHGEIPERQESRLREIGLWYMANHEAVTDIRPWTISNENDIWFTSSKDQQVVYAFVNAPYWYHMEEQAFFIRSLKGSADTKVSILGQNDQMMEYLVHRSPKSIIAIVNEGIFINVVKAQRLNKTWSNPLVIKLEDVEFKEMYK